MINTRYWVKFTRLKLPGLNAVRNNSKLKRFTISCASLFHSDVAVRYNGLLSIFVLEISSTNSDKNNIHNLYEQYSKVGGHNYLKI